MDWPSILLAGVVGALAALIASLIRRRSSRIPYVLLVVTLFFGLKLLSDQTVLPRVHRWQTDRQLRQMPFYRDIAEVDPETYNKIEAVTLDSLQKGEGSNVIASRISPIVAGMLPKYVGSASDDAVTAMIDVTVRKVDELHRIHSDACYFVLFPHASGAPPASSYSDEKTNQEMLDAMGRIVSSAASKPQPLPDAAKAERLLVPVIARLHSDYGDDLVVLQQTPTDSAGRQKYCDATIALYRDVESLPKGDSGLLLRYLLSDRQSKTHP